MNAPQISFTVPGAVPKGRARVFRHKQSGKMVGMTPAKTRAFESAGKLLAMNACRVQGWKKTSQPVELEVRIYRAAMRGDLDNYVKAASDFCNDVVWEDDSQVVRIDAAMFLDRDRPRTEVVVRLAGESSEAKGERA